MQLYRYFVSQSSEVCRHNPCVASEQVFIAVSIYFIMTQSGNFWIYPRTSNNIDLRNRRLVEGSISTSPGNQRVAVANLPWTRCQGGPAGEKEAKLGDWRVSSAISIARGLQRPNTNPPAHV
jgi:hypothetical protein